MPIKKHHRFKGLATLALPHDARAHRAEHLGGDQGKDGAPLRVARDPLHAVDGVPMARGPLLVTGQERGGCEGKQRARCPQRSRSSNVCLAQVIIRERSKAVAHHAQACLSREMLAFFGSHYGHGPPHHAPITSFESEGIFALMFTKGQCR